MTTKTPLVIGMLRGMSWESSAEYYRIANELIRERPACTWQPRSRPR